MQAFLSGGDAFNISILKNRFTRNRFTRNRFARNKWNTRYSGARTSLSINVRNQHTRKSMLGHPPKNRPNTCRTHSVAGKRDKSSIGQPVKMRASHEFTGRINTTIRKSLANEKLTRGKNATLPGAEDVTA